MQIKTIAFLSIARSNFSGGQKNIFRLLLRIDRNKFNPILICQAESELTKKVRNIGICVIILPFPTALDVYEKKLLNLHSNNLFSTLVALQKYHVSIARIFKEISPHVIWCENLRMFLSAYAAGKRWKAIVIWNNWSETEGGVFWFLNRLALLLADVVNLEYYGQGPKLFGKLNNINFLKRKLITLYSGVTDFEKSYGFDIRNELNLSSKDILIIMASNIVPEKGQIDLLQTMEILVKEYSNLHLLLAGESLENHPYSLDYYLELQRYTIKNKLVPYIHFLGWRTDIRDILQVIDIYVSTSYSEGMPDAVREAMNASKPVIASNVGGTSELVCDGKTGFLFRPGDVQSLVIHIRKLIDNPELRFSMGKDNKRIITEKFATDIYVRNFENMVSSLFGS